MNRFKKLITATVIAVLGVSGAAYAADIRTPAEISAALTGKSAAEVTQERFNGKTYGTIAQEAGKLEEFKAQILEQKKLILQQRVQEGRMTQQQADQILASLESNQANCDGSGTARIGQRSGAAFGQGNNAGLGQASGLRNGSGFGQRMGAGRGAAR